VRDLLVARQDGEDQTKPKTKTNPRPSNFFFVDRTTVGHRMFEPRQVLQGNILRYSLSRQYDKLYALLTSSRHQNALGLRKRIPHALVIEGASMARSRIKNKLIKWYAGVLKKVPIPLLESEWMELRDLALGNTPWEGPRKRRTRAGRKPFHLSKMDLERFFYLEDLDPSLPLATEVVRDGIRTSRPLPKFSNHRPAIPLYNIDGTWLESKELRQEATQDILEEELQITDRFVIKAPPGNNPHKMTARSMRRLWAQVFRGIPLLQKMADGTWSVRWGLDELSKKAETPNALDGLFESLEVPRPSGPGRTGDRN
jgi:hypothetical protein